MKGHIGLHVLNVLIYNMYILKSNGEQIFNLYVILIYMLEINNKTLKLLCLDYNIHVMNISYGSNLFGRILIYIIKNKINQKMCR